MAWGEDRYTSGSAPTSFRFTGQRVEDYIKLYWFGSRWYDPALSRWAQPDSIIPVPGIPTSWDRYAYSFNRPTKYIDPTGHKPLVDEGTPPPPYRPTSTPPATPPSLVLPKPTQETPEHQYDPGTSPTGPGINSTDQNNQGEFPYKIEVDWDKVDLIDLCVDIAGLGGDAAAAVFQQPQLWFISELAEAAGLIKDFHDVITDNDFTGMTTDTFVFTLKKSLPILIPDGVRLVGPGFGTLANLFSLAQNVIPAIKIEEK